MKSIRLILVCLLLLSINFSLSAKVLNKVVATVNGEPIMLSDLEHLLQPVYKRYAQIYSGHELEKRKRYARRQLLDQLIENKIILQVAKEAGVEISEAILEEQLAEVKDKFGSIEEFEEALKSEGINLEEYKEDFNEQLTVRAMVEKEVISKVKVRPQEMVSYYAQHEDEFIEPEQIRIGHILIRGRDNQEAAKKYTRNVYEQLKAGGDFTALAKEYSQGPRAEDGGDLGFIPKGQLKPELEEVIASLKPGEYSKIIETKIGYHIILLKERTPAEEQQLSEVWDSLEDKLFRERVQEYHTEWMDSLKEKAHIKIIDVK